MGKNNINLEIEEFFILISILSSIILIISIINFPNPIIAILISILMIFILFISINIRRKRENFKKEIQLEQFLLDLKGNLYGNPNLLNSLKKTTSESEYPLKKDFEMVINDTRRGLLVEEALKKMVNRNSSYVIEVILTGFIIANQKGADLILFISDQIEYLREKRNVDNYIKIVSAGPKYTAYIIMLVPLVVLCAIILINRNIVEILFSGFGLICMSYVILSNAIGLFLINRMVSYPNESR